MNLNKSNLWLHTITFFWVISSVQTQAAPFGSQTYLQEKTKFLNEKGSRSVAQESSMQANSMQGTSNRTSVSQDQTETREFVFRQGQPVRTNIGRDKVLEWQIKQLAEPFEIELGIIANSCAPNLQARCKLRSSILKFVTRATWVRHPDRNKIGRLAVRVVSYRGMAPRTYDLQSEIFLAPIDMLSRIPDFYTRNGATFSNELFSCDQEGWFPSSAKSQNVFTAKSIVLDYEQKSQKEFRSVRFRYSQEPGTFLHRYTLQSMQTLASEDFNGIGFFSDKMRFEFQLPSERGCRVIFQVLPGEFQRIIGAVFGAADRPWQQLVFGENSFFRFPGSQNYLVQILNGYFAAEGASVTYE